MKVIKLSLALAAATVLVAGCGSGLMGAARGDNAAMSQYDASAVGDASGSVGVPHRAKGGMRGHRGMPMIGMLAQRLELSADQKTKLQAIFESYQGKLAPADGQAKHARLKELLSAPSVDGAALKSFLTEQHDAMAAKVDTFLALAGELRVVLTDAQREKLAAFAEHAHQKGRFGMPGMAGSAPFPLRALRGLQLDATQSAAVDALKAKLEASRQQRDPKAMRDAFAAFVRTGDAAAFKAILQAQRPTPPVDEVVALAVSLDSTQRQSLLDKFGRHHPGKPPRR